MSSIKPPDGRGAGGGAPVATLPGATPAAGEAGGAVPAGGADFRDALARAEGAAGGPSAEAQAAAGVKGGDPLAELAGLLRSGALTREQAVERLIDRALSQVGRGLNDAQRAELAVVLRTALEADPALQALRDDLGR
jgi:hypothetical protein